MTPIHAQLAVALRAGALNDAPVIAQSNQGRIARLDFQGRALVIKQAAGHGPVARVNRWALAREARAYARLAGVAGIVGCHGLIDGRWLALEYIEAQPFRATEVGPAFFRRLFETLRAMHERGVAHGDLKRKSNLLVAEDGRPVVLDFGAAFLRQSGFHPVNRKLFEFLRQTDLNAWVKLKYGGYDHVAESDQRFLRRSRLERWLARIRSD